MHSLFPLNPSVKYQLANILGFAHTELDLIEFSIQIFATFLKLWESTLKSGILASLTILEAWLQWVFCQAGCVWLSPSPQAPPRPASSPWHQGECQLAPVILLPHYFTCGCYLCELCRQLSVWPLSWIQTQSPLSLCLPLDFLDSWVWSSLINSFEKDTAINPLKWWRHQGSVCVLVSQLWQFFVTPWTVDCQTPLSMEFTRQGYWSVLPFLSPGDLPDPGIEPKSPALQANSLPSDPPGKPC